MVWFQLNRLVGRVFANGLGGLGSIPGCVILKTLKMVLDTSLLNTQQYKLCIKGKVDQSKEKSSTLPCTSVPSLLKRGPSGCPRLLSPTYYKEDLALNNLQLLICHKTQPSQNQPYNSTDTVTPGKMDCSTLPLIHTFYRWELSKEVSSTILKSLVWHDLGLNPGLPDHWWTTIVGYLMPNPLYTCMLIYMIWFG